MTGAMTRISATPAAAQAAKTGFFQRARDAHSAAAGATNCSASAREPLLRVFRRDLEARAVRGYPAVEAQVQDAVGELFDRVQRPGFCEHGEPYVLGWHGSLLYLQRVLLGDYWLWGSTGSFMECPLRPSCRSLAGGFCAYAYRCGVSNNRRDSGRAAPQRLSDLLGAVSRLLSGAGRVPGYACF